MGAQACSRVKGHGLRQEQAFCRSLRLQGFMRWHNNFMPWWMLLAVVGLLAPQVIGQADFIQQEVKYIWPVMTWTVPLVPGLLEASAASKLAQIGEKAFDKYVQDILPQELK